MQFNHGLLSRYYRRKTALPKSTKKSKKFLKKWVKSSSTSWSLIQSNLDYPNFPDTSKYDLSTWESTIALDYHSNLETYGTDLLNYGNQKNLTELVVKGCDCLHHVVEFKVKRKQIRSIGLTKNMGLCYQLLLLVSGKP